ncbi:ABC transporter ATP-binding protein [Amycolatopsis sp. EV170708-02-1]|uniref:ATP-binding cassette domain-containing protein n=1 Tax=Amycolatopsis sp. EV170708-02-1 TaxID=2919322 RepID=UPI001F0C7308|nr:ABC transporter ATP-binding protein [Amycolatopsis sp. EV170708-02-1]UMP06775.1 ABC transporter ATP-binding protein/permease [Amycolatopsis sp. EV170708-02-1]
MRFAFAALRRRPLLRLLAWSVPEVAPAMISGVALARAVDDGFLAGRPAVGLAWLAGLLVAGGIGAIGSRHVFRCLGDLVEPLRDDLARRVVGGALLTAVAGKPDRGALARLTRQVEIVRDTYAGLLVVLRGFAVTVAGVVIGLLSVAPILIVLIAPPFLLGCAAFVATLGLAADRQRDAVIADERLAAAAALALSGTRDVVASGAEEHASAMVAEPIERQASAARALARVDALRTLCFALGGWVPLLAVLIAGPWLAGRGLTTGEIMGGLTYVLIGLQPALRELMSGLGGTGLRFVITLGRILDAGPPPLSAGPPPSPALNGYDVVVRGLTFAYGPGAEPVLNDLYLCVPEGEHLAVVGPSGIGKSTLVGLLCGLLRPSVGVIELGGVPVDALPAGRLADARVLIPQEAYVFTGTVLANLTYLRPDATRSEVDLAVTAVGADHVMARLGGLEAELTPAGLSAGEGQLIALVRAYLSPAPVAVLDEATCHLDPAAERRAENAFAERGGTLVVIAHRISSALRARRVLVLDGTGATIGDHDTLVRTSPLYRELLGHWHPDALARPDNVGTPRPEGVRVRAW